ncbi:GNAT family N-acetyltransferase [Spiroplasma endosymbiont of Tiphia femorata]|uniref:GNAT family N-acetyltransferase n=1 Tax=Spiroplasma endosymbiont of Tiphia femorata TaxID=3066326 RepID=UPI0030D60748
MENLKYIIVKENKDFNLVHKIWKKNVLKTHVFLKHEHFLLFNKTLKENLNNLNVQLWYKNDYNQVIGFSIILEQKLEALFLDINYLNQGFGSKILKKLIKEFNINQVDVNEQNTRAYSFYLKNGFIFNDRKELDNFNLPYPTINLIFKGD